MFFCFSWHSYFGIFIVQSTRARRPGDDDFDAQERLPGLLNDSYYRNVLCKYGAFFAIARHIDLVHKNPWIGFQPWRASSKNVSLFIVVVQSIQHSCYLLHAVIMAFFQDVYFHENGHS